MEEVKHRFLWLKIITIIFLVILLIILYTRYIGTSGLKTKEYNIIDNNIPTSFYGYKIMQLSDLHYNNTTQKKDLDKIINKINKSKPDIIIISGDLLDKKQKYDDQDNQDLIEFLNNIQAKYKYIITGENDLSERFKDIIAKSDFKLLDNNYDILYNNDYEAILIGGLSTKSDGMDINEKIATIQTAMTTNNTKYNILVIHEPSLIEEFDYSAFNLILAGHTHQGQLNIPFIKKLMVDKKDQTYLDDFYDYDKTKLYISSGIGTKNIKARLFNKPSMNLYRLLNR